MTGGTLPLSLYTEQTHLLVPVEHSSKLEALSHSARLANVRFHADFQGFGIAILDEFGDSYHFILSEHLLDTFQHYQL
jgi:hypothetical protein